MAKLKSNQADVIALENKLHRLKEIDVDSGEYLLDKFFAFRKLTEGQKATLKKQWDEYYQKCRNTRAFTIFGEMRLAFEAKNFNHMRNLQQEIKQILADQKFITPPPFLDPEEVSRSNRIQDYIAIEKKISELQGFEGAVKEALY